MPINQIEYLDQQAIKHSKLRQYDYLLVLLNQIGFYYSDKELPQEVLVLLNESTTILALLRMAKSRLGKTALARFLVQVLENDSTLIKNILNCLHL